MDVQVRDVMTHDEGVHMLGGNALHEGTGRQRLEGTNTFRSSGRRSARPGTCRLGSTRSQPTASSTTRPSHHVSPPAASRRDG